MYSPIRTRRRALHAPRPRRGDGRTRRHGRCPSAPAVRGKDPNARRPPRHSANPACRTAPRGRRECRASTRRPISAPETMCRSVIASMPLATSAMMTPPDPATVVRKCWWKACETASRNRTRQATRITTIHCMAICVLEYSGSTGMTAPASGLCMRDRRSKERASKGSGAGTIRFRHGTLPCGDLAAGVMEGGRGVLPPVVSFCRANGSGSPGPASRRCRRAANRRPAGTR